MVEKEAVRSMEMIVVSGGEWKAPSFRSAGTHAMMSPGRWLLSGDKPDENQDGD